MEDTKDGNSFVVVVEVVLFAGVEYEVDDGDVGGGGNGNVAVAVALG